MLEDVLRLLMVLLDDCDVVEWLDSVRLLADCELELCELFVALLVLALLEL